MAEHNVVVVVLDGVLPIDLGVPTQIFGPRSDTDYVLTVCGRGRTVRTSFGFTIEVPAGLEALEEADTVLVPGYENVDDDPPPDVLRALRLAAERGARMVSICTGAFALAAAGLLRGRRATTHWADLSTLTARFDDITIDRNSLFVRDGAVFTSAGVTAAIDLCLELVAIDLGPVVANGVARHIVAARHRELGQAAFVDRALPIPRAGGLAHTRAWALDQLDQPLTTDDLAQHARMSLRTLTRTWRAETGCSPQRWLLRARVDAARELLERSDLSVDPTAALCGFGSSTNLRARFRDLTGTTPTSYRRAFGTNEVAQPHDLALPASPDGRRRGS